MLSLSFQSAVRRCGPAAAGVVSLCLRLWRRLHASWLCDRSRHSVQKNAVATRRIVAVHGAKQATVRRRAVARVLVLASLLAFQPARADSSDWLYQVDLPVADQSPGARQRVASEALQIVLMRLTGLADLSGFPALQPELRQPDNYYTRFGYLAGAEPGVSLLSLQFSPAVVLALIRTAGMPVWPSARPDVTVWVLVDQDDAFRIVQADTADPVAAALQARAERRGLKLELAAMRTAVGQPPREDSPPALAPMDPVAGGLEPEMRGLQSPEVPAGDPAGWAIPAAPDPVADQGQPVPVVDDPIPGPEDLALRPALPGRLPVWPTVALREAELVDLAALAHTSPGALSVVVRMRGAAADGWSAQIEMHDPAGPGETVGLAGAPDASAGTEMTDAVVTDAPHGDSAMTDTHIDSGSIAEAAPFGDGVAGAQAPGSGTPFGGRKEALAAASPDALAALVVDRIVDALLARYQVAAGTVGQLAMTVTGIGVARDYAEVLALLARIEVIDQVDVTAAVADEISLRLTTQASAAQLLALLSGDPRLVPVAAEPRETRGDGSMDMLPGFGQSGASRPFTEAPEPIALQLHWQDP